jgi:hypothetical protein
MEPVALVVTALAAGAGLGLKTTASSAVTDAYTSLKSLTRKRLAGRRDGELVLSRHKQAPEAWQGPLTAELAAAGAGNDAGLVAAAQALMTLIDAAGSQAGKYTVDARDSWGVLIGDGNRQQYIETYIHSQVIQSPVTTAPTAVRKPGSGRDADSSSKTNGRLEAAANLHRINVSLGIPAYQAIVADSAAKTNGRLEAAVNLHRINVSLGLSAYQTIAQDP